MAKAEILQYLTKQKRKGINQVDIPELCRAIPVNRTNITRSCRTLNKDKDIKIKPVKIGNFTKFIISLN